MTLIAGFYSFDVPVLIGDFLTTTTRGTWGLRKKILKISDSFALSWTGHLVAADAVIRVLQSSIDVDNVDLQSVKSVLTQPAMSSQLSPFEVRLVCWVVDSNGQHCFRWNSLYPLNCS